MESSLACVFVCFFCFACVRSRPPWLLVFLTVDSHCRTKNVDDNTLHTFFRFRLDYTTTPHAHTL